MLNSFQPATGFPDKERRGVLNSSPFQGKSRLKTGLAQRKGKETNLSTIQSEASPALNNLILGFQKRHQAKSKISFERWLSR